MGKITHQICHFHIFPQSTLVAVSNERVYHGGRVDQITPHSRCGISFEVFFALKVRANLEVYSVT